MVGFECILIDNVLRFSKQFDFNVFKFCWSILFMFFIKFKMIKNFHFVSYWTEKNLISHTLNDDVMTMMATMAVGTYHWQSSSYSPLIKTPRRVQGSSGPRAIVSSPAARPSFSLAHSLVCWVGLYNRLWISLIFSRILFGILSDSMSPWSILLRFQEFVVFLTGGNHTTPCAASRGDTGLSEQQQRSW